MFFLTAVFRKLLILLRLYAIDRFDNFLPFSQLSARPRDRARRSDRKARRADWPKQSAKRQDVKDRVEPA